MSDKFTISCPCLFGLESVLSGEVKRMGAENVRAEDGRVLFDGDYKDIVKANLRLRTAERVQIVAGNFMAMTYDELFEGTYSIPWDRYIAKGEAFPVKGRAIKSQLYSMSDCQSIIKKAIAKRLGEAYHCEWLDESKSTVQVQFMILKNRVLLMLDSSGDGLHKRGYRKNALEAPIKETIAAGIADLAHVRPDTSVCDPMCGSGTLLIESALKALKIAPGLSRHFAAEKWSIFPNDIWKEERELCLSEVDRTSTFHAYGYDIDPEAIRLTTENARNAGVIDRFTIEQRDARKFIPPEAEKLVILCNPPYGERLLSEQEAEELYRSLGKVLTTGENRSFSIISPHEQFEQVFGRAADKRRKLYNGMIKCQLYMYYK